MVIERACLLALSWAAGTLPRSLNPMQEACVNPYGRAQTPRFVLQPLREIRITERSNGVVHNGLELKAQIDACPDGGAVGLPYDTFADRCPPGEPDHNAREAAFNFAKVNGCTIDNKPDANVVFFVKPKKPS